MGRIIIEYCGGWGYGGPANRLKKAIVEHIPGLEVECISAGKMTSKIEVYWVSGDERKAIWSNGKAATEENHKEIVNLIKQHMWAQKSSKNWKLSVKWR